MNGTYRGERWPQAVVLLAAASAACVGLVMARVAYSREQDYAFLVWNLALAWVPLLLALAAWLGYRLGWPRPVLACLAGLWLLFLPNAPYILTDFVHLTYDYHGAPLAFDALSIAAYAVTGLLLGFASLYLMQAVMRRVLGERATWLLVAAILSLSSVGIYLGRYQRLNSWDAIRHPGSILDMVWVRAQDPLGNEALIAMTVAFTSLLVASYVAVYALVVPRFEARLRGRPGGR
jgi:uncharacterized membrane protein